MIDATIWTSAMLGVVQGLTEFLPISSSGHLIVVREFFGTVGAGDLAFDALLHFATALAIVVYFWRDIWQLIIAAVRLPQKFLQKALIDEYEEMALALIAGTVPAVILGLLLEDIMATLFRNPLLVAGALLVGSCIMLLAEHYKNSCARGVLGHGWRRGLVIGLFQSLALIPGMSRSGMTISGGMLFGMERGEAARFGFLLGVPLLLGAGVKKAFELGLFEISADVVAGAIAAFIVALLVIHYLLKFLRSHTLHIFIVYRIALALLILIVVFV